MKKTEKAVKRIITMLLMLCVLALSVPVTGQAASPAAQAKKSVNTFFQAVKSVKVTKMERCLEPHAEFIFQQPYLLRNILRPYCKKTTWKIKGCKVRGERAVVRVRVDYESLRESYETALDDMLHYAIRHPGVTEEVLLRQCIRSFKRDAEKYGSTGYYYPNLKIHLRKVGGKWKITKPVDELVNIASCGSLDGLDDFLGTERGEYK